MIPSQKAMLIGLIETVRPAVDAEWDSESESESIVHSMSAEEIFTVIRLSQDRSHRNRKALFSSMDKTYGKSNTPYILTYCELIEEEIWT